MRQSSATDLARKKSNVQKDLACAQAAEPADPGDPGVSAMSKRKPKYTPQFSINIECSNAAFEPNPFDEICDLLEDIITELRQRTPPEGNDLYTSGIADSNGNLVGHWIYGMQRQVR